MSIPPGTPPKVVQRAISNPEQPDINSIRALCPQAVCCGQKVGSGGPASTAYVNGDILPMVVGLDLRADVPLIYLVAEPGDLLLWAGWSSGPR